MESVDFEAKFLEALRSVGEKARPVAIASEPTEEIETDAGVDDDDKVAEVTVPKPTRINLFQHPDAHPYALDLALLRKYQLEWMEWEPETLEIRIPQDFRTTGVSDLNMGKLLAMRTMHLVGTPWREWEVFNWCTMAVNNLFADFEVLQVPTYAQCAVMVDIAQRVRTDVPWSEEVTGFVSVVARTDGIFCPVAPADFIEIDDDGLMVDAGRVAELWPSIRKSGIAPTGDTILAEQLRRALIVHEYVMENRLRLQSQLPMVLNV